MSTQSVLKLFDINKIIYLSVGTWKNFLSTKLWIEANLNSEEDPSSSLPEAMVSTSLYNKVFFKLFFYQLESAVLQNLVFLKTWLFILHNYFTKYLLNLFTSTFLNF